MKPQELVEKLVKARTELKNEISKTIVGQDEVVNLVLIALFSQGHSLIVGVPGLAKTLLISSIADMLGLDFNRIQFTPDLMPADIIGTDILEESASGKRNFRFIKGPLFANIILADEINRTPPKTQSALLQAMQEYKVTAGGTTYPLEMPFFVLATQNPIEQEGTYPLPEAQLDRFFFHIAITYPTIDEETEIIKRTTSAEEVKLRTVLHAKEIVELQKVVRHVPASDAVIDFAVRCIRSTRPEDDLAPKWIKDWVRWGAGPRASQNLILAAKAKTILEGRHAVSIEDVKELALHILRHRIILNFNAEAEGIPVEHVIEKVIAHAKH